MPVLIILIVVGLLLGVQGVIYRKYWGHKLTAQVDFQDHFMLEGNETVITEVMTNDKMLPLPWVHLKFQIKRNGKSVNIFRSDVFNILFHQRITRTSSIRLEHRGIYQINKLDLLSYDLFITKKFVKAEDNTAEILIYPKGMEQDEIIVPYEKIMGDVATKRYTMEDPFLFKGIREYGPQDNFKSINFKASAKAGKWLVNTHEYTLDQTVRVLLLTDRGTDYFVENVYEAGLRLAVGLISQLERDGIPASLYSNGLDSLDHQEVNLQAGCSESHIESVLAALARIDLTITGMAGDEVIRSLLEKYEPEDYYVIICPDYSNRMLSAYEELREYTTSCVYLAPISKLGANEDDEVIREIEKRVEGFFFHQV